MSKPEVHFLVVAPYEIFDGAWAVWGGGNEITVNTNSWVTYCSLQGYRKTDVGIMKESIGKLVLHNARQNNEAEPGVYLWSLPCMGRTKTPSTDKQTWRLTHVNPHRYGHTKTWIHTQTHAVYKHEPLEYCSIKEEKVRNVPKRLVGWLGDTAVGLLPGEGNAKKKTTHEYKQQYITACYPQSNNVWKHTFPMHYAKHTSL